MQFRLDKAILRRYSWPVGTLFFLTSERYTIGCTDGRCTELFDLRSLEYALTWIGQPEATRLESGVVFRVDISVLVGFEAEYAYMPEADSDAIWKGDKVISCTPYPVLPLYKGILEYDKNILSRPL